MIYRKVLIVDDELTDGDDPRERYYLDLIGELNRIDPKRYQYTPLLCDSEDKVTTELNNLGNSIGELISIVDLVLEESDLFPESGIDSLLDGVLEKSRIAFFTTRRLESAKISTLIKFQQANRSAGLFPFELLVNQSSEFARLIHRGLVESDNGDTAQYIEYLNAKELNTINILVLSDFHFSDPLKRIDETDLVNTMEAIQDELEDRRLDMVFCLGDFTDKGQESGYGIALTFVERVRELANFPQLPSDFVYSVPGNHDIVVPLALSAYIDKPKSEYTIKSDAVSEGLVRYGILPYYFFRNKISKGLQFFGPDSDDPIQSKRHWIDLKWQKMGFVTVGLDSNSQPSPKSHVVGEIDAESLAEFRNLLMRIPKEERSRLVLVFLAHHYTGDGASERGINEPDLLRKHCSELKFKGVVFINGDRHGDPMPQLGRQLLNNGTVPLEIATPTFSQHNRMRKEGALRGSFLLTLESDGSELKGAKTRSFVFREHGLVEASPQRQFTVDKNGWRKS